jgi:hypothetical protein
MALAARLGRALFVVHALLLLHAVPRALAADQDSGASPRVRPWVPSGFDSLQTWAAQARVEFRDQPRDAIDSVTVLPYNHAGAIAVRWLRSLGRSAAPQAKAIEVALDSLGFDTEIISDPALPNFMLLVVRNPFRVTASAMGYMFWRRGDNLLQQGVELRGGQSPQMRVWWTGERDASYKWAILDRSHHDTTVMRFFLFRLSADGGLWVPAQYEGNGPDLGDAHTAGFEDVNGDGLPEVVSWSDAPADTLFEACTGCPRRLIERIYTERKDEGFALNDSRLVPAPYSMFVLFIRLLVDHNHPAAARLLYRPAKLDEAIGWGWGTRRAPGTWKLEMTENESWPRWLQFRFRGVRGVERYVVRFTQKDGRWLIENWKRTASPATGTSRK